MDCVLEERRLHKLMTTDRATLFELQRMRRNRLIDGAIAVTPSHLEFLGEDEPAEPEERTVEKRHSARASRSNDRPIGGIFVRAPASAIAGTLGTPKTLQDFSLGDGKSFDRHRDREISDR
jgi:hypothetical protein